MSTINSIHQLRREGAGISEIAKTLNISRNTVYTYLAQDDYSPKLPIRQTRESKLDPYKAIIDEWLLEDTQNWRKQRHSATRIWQRLVEEYGAEIGQSTVRRYVSEKRNETKQPKEQYLDLVWSPGEAQADFGEADFYFRGIRMRLSFFVLTFPFSNVGLAQIFPGENAECVCQALKNIFEYIGGVPKRIVFDNATGVGRKTCEVVRTTSLFKAFAAHYGFAFSFCNPNAGHEKGNVENKVGFIRRNLFVPIPQFFNAKLFNTKLLERCMQLSNKNHWLKNEPEIQLFVEDRFALDGLPLRPFNVVHYETCKADKLGKIRIEGCHLYSSAPQYANSEIIAAIGATCIELYTQKGEFISKHDRAYGKAPTDSTDPASQLPLLCMKPGAWQNSQIRASLSDDLRNYLDTSNKEDLKKYLRLMRDVTANSGWSSMLFSLESAFTKTGRIDEASVRIGALRQASGMDGIVYDDPVDLGIYDEILSRTEVI